MDGAPPTPITTDGLAQIDPREADMEATARAAAFARAPQRARGLGLTLDEYRLRRRAMRRAREMGLGYWPALAYGPRDIDPRAYVAAEQAVGLPWREVWDSEGYHGLTAEDVAAAWRAAGCRPSAKFHAAVRAMHRGSHYDRPVLRRGDTVPWLRAYLRGWYWLQRRHTSANLSRKAVAALGRLSPLARWVALRYARNDVSLIRLRDLGWHAVRRLRGARDVRSLPHWQERVAAGWLPTPWDLTGVEARALQPLRDRLQAIQRERAGRRCEEAYWREMSFAIGDYTARVRRNRWNSALLVERDGECVVATADGHQWPLIGPYGPLPRGIFAAARELAEILRAGEPDPDAPDTLGWRIWLWRRDKSGNHVLMSPVRRTPWPGPELRAECWSLSAAVEGEAGVHALRMPRDWRRAVWQQSRYCEGLGAVIIGVVERWGHAVVGSRGWRAEWVRILELQAPDAETALAIMQRYPEVRVHVRGGDDGYRTTDQD